MLNEIEMRGPIEWLVIDLRTRLEVARVWATTGHAARRASGYTDVARYVVWKA